MKTALVLEDVAAASQWLTQMLAEVFPGIEVRTAATLAQARRLTRGFKPDIALVDLGLPDGSGVELIERLAREAPDCQCIVTTLFADDQHLFPALRAGARGYLLKDQPREHLQDGLRRIVAGEPPLSPAIAQRLLRVFQAGTRPNASADEKLSARETEVLTLLAKGLPLAELAEKLGITRNTSASHVKAIYRKLNISTRAEAALEAARMGLVNTQI
ncbi:MAG: response regulator transcription factor [Pseudomonadota bacterium]